LEKAPEGWKNHGIKKGPKQRQDDLPRIMMKKAHLGLEKTFGALKQLMGHNTPAAFRDRPFT